MKLFFKNTTLAKFNLEKESPFFYSTYYKNISPIFLTPKEKQIIPLLSQDLEKANKKLTSQYIHNSYRLKLLKLELIVLLNQIPNYEFTEIKIPPFAPAPLKARYLYLKSLFDIYKTDLNSASTSLSQALKIFKSKQHFYECGLCYLSLAEIYKICGCFDITYTMLQEAEKIYSTQISIPQKQAEIKALFGLNELYYENYSNAQLYFNEALQLSTPFNLTTSHIKNWQSLCYLQQNKLEKALNLLQEARIPKLEKPALLFNLELTARIYKQLKQYSQSLEHIDTALKIAKQLNNTPIIFELNYLKAEVFYQTQKTKSAQKILTSIIKEKHSPSLPIYKANAYTLLGIIALENNNLNRAQNLFKQSLDLENSKSRTTGLAIDYNNLAATYFKQGNPEKAKHYLQLALEEANSTTNTTLISHIQQKLSNL